MDKIICEVCGTSYPGTAQQCPICGYAKPSEPRSAPAAQDAGGRYQYVRGGRFSSDNVRKRMESRDAAPVYYTRESAPVSRREEQAPQKKGSNFIFGIIAIILLVALILVLAWFIMDIVYDRFILVEGTGGSVSGEQKPQPEISLNFTELTFERAGDTVLLQPQMVPADPGAVFSFSSADASVATVDADGVVNAVAPGSTVITVYSGSIMTELTVNCVFATTAETTAPEKFELNREDITFGKKGEAWDICGSATNVAKNKITWSTDDEKIAAIEGGVVTAVGPGVTKVHGEYNGKKLSCTIRCSFPADPTEATEDGDTATHTYTISHKDVTIAVDESFSLVLQDEDKKAVAVEWKVSADGIVTIDGNKVTGVKGGSNVVISTTYEGKTYKCTVRVKKN